MTNPIDRRDLALQALEAIRYISEHGTSADNDVMTKLILLTPEARLRIRETVGLAKTKVWTTEQFDDAALFTIVQLAKDIKRDREKQ